MKHYHMAIFLAGMMLCACGERQPKTVADVDSFSIEDILSGAEDFAAAEDTTAAEPQKGIEQTAKPLAPVREENGHSRFYEEGRHRGYADGEEDAFTHRGWQATYDDGCDYRGWEKSEYERGYEEGYEAGFEG